MEGNKDDLCLEEMRLETMTLVKTPAPMEEGNDLEEVELDTLKLPPESFPDYYGKRYLVHCTPDYRGKRPVLLHQKSGGKQKTQGTAKEDCCSANVAKAIGGKPCGK
jgi:hypothetical protein